MVDESAETSESPKYWLEAAGRELPSHARTIRTDHDLLFLARGFLESGDTAARERAATLIAHPAIRKAAAAPPRAENPDTSAPRPTGPENDSVNDLIAAARIAYDTLDFEAGRELLAKAESAAGGLPSGPEREAACALVAAARYQLGSADLARRTMQSIDPAAGPPGARLPFPVILEFARTDAIAPCLDWLAAHRDESPESLETAFTLASTIDSRWRFREPGELAFHASRADPGAPPNDERQLHSRIWSAVESGAVSRARSLAESAPRGERRAAAFLTLARALLWRRSPSDPKSESDPLAEDGTS